MSYINLPGPSAVGTTTNDNAPAGNIGEVITGSVLRSAANGLADGVTENIGTGTNITLTAGDWDVSGFVGFLSTTATVTTVAYGIATTSATLPGADVTAVPTSGQVKLVDYFGTTTTTVERSFSIARYRVSVAASTPVYLVASASFSAGTVAAYGSITARRAR